MRGKKLNMYIYIYTHIKIKMKNINGNKMHEKCKCDKKLINLT
jgi:hypothetical protein